MAFSSGSSAILLLLFTGGLMMSYLLLTLVSAESRLDAGQSLLTNNFLSYGSYYLRVKIKCEIVFQNEETKLQIWSSNTKDKGIYCRLHMNPNGDLEILQGMGEGGAVVWTSRTRSSRITNSYLLVAEGNVSIHDDNNDVIWVNGEKVHV